METITAQQLITRIHSGEELYILDVREPAEYEALNMGAKLIPLGQIMNAQIDEIEDWRNKEVIVHCKSGMRSMQACMILEQMGFQKTVNLQGGILAWNEIAK
jgi:rhodanese-related sulfurtransferase